MLAEPLRGSAQQLTFLDTAHDLQPKKKTEAAGAHQPAEPSAAEKAEADRR